MNRREALGTLAGAAVMGRAQNRNRPNLVFILVDDLRFDALSVMGHPFVKTPHIDRIAREGVIFKNAFVTTPLCSPSRASYLTGRYVRSHGVKGNGDSAELSHKLITFPRLLHDAGYETAYIGKWHMGNDDFPRPGIDRWVSFRGQGRYEDPPLNVDGQRVEKKGYMTDLLSDYAVEFLGNQRSKPFCLYLAHKAVHGPFTPAGRHANLFSGNPVVRAQNAKDDLDGKPMLKRPLPAPSVPNKKGNPNNQRGPGDEVIRNQMRCLTAIDEGVGRMLQTLEQTKQLDNTMIVFTSDNGFFWGEHGLGDKRAAYEESIRIPMFVRYPKAVKAGTSVEEMVLNIDIAPTFLQMAGVPAPKQMQGRSMAPLLGGRTKGWRTHILCEYVMEAQFARIASWEAVRTSRWKYIHYPDLMNMDELYDLQSDAGELVNRIGLPVAKQITATLRKELGRYRREIQP
ncbi:MAG TPA: sulfatase [Bryobacteraceae bacterium]|nr:sulfatase [Bryobacteraceae bacterium]